MKKIMLMAAMVAGFSSTAMARGGTAGDGVYFGIHVNPMNRADKQTQAGTTLSDSDWATMNMDLLLGYKMSSGLYLGGMYESNSRKENKSGYTDSTGGLGASVGYMNSGFMLIAHLFLTSEGKEKSGGVENKWSKGSAMGFDIGYQFNVSGPFNLGAELSYRSMEFKKVESGGVSADNVSWKMSGYEPKLVFGFMF